MARKRQNLTIVRKHPNIALILAALFPVFLHIILMAVVILQNHSLLEVEKDYILVHILFLVYTLVVIFSSDSREHLIRLILVAYSAIFVILACELCLNLSSDYKFYTPRTPYIKRSAIAHKTSMPGISGIITLSANRYGVRGQDVDLDKTDIKILAVGGSTTECAYVTDKVSWPWRLQDMLSQRLGTSVFVGNAAGSGKFTLHTIYLLKNYKWLDKFDWVIMICGLNDMGTLLRNNYESRKREIDKYPTYYRNSKVFSLFENLAKYLAAKYISKDHAVRDTRGKWYIKVRKIRKEALKINAVNQLPPNLDEAIQIYKNNVLEIIDICREKDLNLLIITEPTIWHKNLSSDLKELLWQHVTEEKAYTVEALEKTIKIYNLATIEVCEKEGVPYIDLASMLAKDTSVFYDDCHYNNAGCERVANIVADFFCGIYMPDKKKR